MVKNDKLDAILNCEYDTEEGKEKLENILKRIKPFTKMEKVKITDLEKFIYKATKKYAIKPQPIFMNCIDGDKIMYSISILDESKHYWLGNIYGTSFKELLIKQVILYKHCIKNKKVELREDGN